MKLIRIGHAGNERPGVITAQGKRIDVSAFGEDYDAAFLSSDGLKRLSNWLQEHETSCPEVDSNERLGPPISQVSKIVCVGLNYAQHAKESGMEVPSEPVLFFKATSAICGPNDDLIIPKGGEKTDWEVETGSCHRQKSQLRF